MMKPSRSLSNGREAAAGSSLRRESAWSAANPAMEMGLTAASAPPASMTSASPRSMMRMALPMLWRPEAHAETTA